jgi:hypothetical protein
VGDEILAALPAIRLPELLQAPGDSAAWRNSTHVVPVGRELSAGDLLGLR